MKKNSGILLILTALFVFVSVYALIHHTRCISFPYPLEYREGVVQYFVNCFVKNNPLYPEIKENPPYMHNPYTPFYFFITGILQKILPQIHTFFAGRLLSFLCLLVTCLSIFKIVKQRASTSAGLIASGLFLCSPVLINYGSIEIVDMLALCTGILGIFAAEEKTKKGLFISGILCSLSFLTKPLFFLPAIGIFIAIMISKEKKKNWFLVPFVVMTVFVFFYLFLKYKSSVFNHLIILNTLPFSFSHFLNVFSQTGVRHSFLFGFLAMFIVLNKDKKSPLYWYCVLSPLTLLFSSKTGAESNYFLEIIALSSIATGIVFEKIEPSMKNTFLLTCMAQMFLFLPFKPAPVFTKTYGQEIPGVIYSEPGKVLKEAGDIITGELMAVSDPVLSEDIGWLVAAEKEVLVEPYQFSNLAKYGRWNDAFIVDMIKEKQFNLIVMTAESYEGTTEKFTENMINAIKENYSIKRVIGNTYILEPLVSWDSSSYDADCEIKIFE